MYEESAFFWKISSLKAASESKGAEILLVQEDSVCHRPAFLRHVYYTNVSHAMCFSVTVNLADSRNQRVDMTHFDLLKVLGTGGRSERIFYSRH